MDWRADRIGAALRDANPMVMARLPVGFAVFGDVQWLPGYSVLLVDRLGIDRLSQLPEDDGVAFLASTARLAAAVESVCARFDPAFRRVNIEILGNADPFLHAHVWPRYSWEPADLVTRPVWLYPPSYWSDPAHAAGAEHAELRAAITEELSSWG